jgi:hypothetical protein
MKRPITSRMHGMLDYPAGVLLIAAPWIFGFSDVGNGATAIPIVVGALVILQSLITDYELSLANVLPLRAHLGLDVVAGAFLALSPFLFGFSDEGTNAWLPHVLGGLLLIGSGLMTQTHRETPRRRTRLDTGEARTGERLAPSRDRTRTGSR